MAASFDSERYHRRRDQSYWRWTVRSWSYRRQREPALPRKPPHSPPLIGVRVRRQQKRRLRRLCVAFDITGRPIPAPVFLRCRRNIPHDNARAQLCVLLCFSFLLLGLLAGVGHCFSFHFIQLSGDHFFSESDKPVIATASDVLDLKVEIANGHFDTPSASKECRLSREWRTTSDGKRQ